MPLYAVWKVWFKIKINRTFQQSCQDIANIVQDPITHKAPRPVEEVVEEVAEYEQQLFDDIAEIFLSLKVSSRDPEDAETIQQEVLNKMPAKAHTQIRQLDLGSGQFTGVFTSNPLNILSANTEFLLPM